MKYVDLKALCHPLMNRVIVKNNLVASHGLKSSKSLHAITCPQSGTVSFCVEWKRWISSSDMPQVINATPYETIQQALDAFNRCDATELVVKPYNVESLIFRNDLASHCYANNKHNKRLVVFTQIKFPISLVTIHVEQQHVQSIQCHDLTEAINTYNHWETFSFFRVQ